MQSTVKWRWAGACLAFVACAGRPGQASAPKLEPTGDPTTPVAVPSPATGTSAAATPTAGGSRDAGALPLSTPNPIAHRAADAAVTDDAGSNEDPRTRALRRIAENAQACHARYTAGVAGKLVLRLSRASDGKVQSASLVREDSSKALLVDVLERCVLDGAKRETLPAPISEDENEMQIPLTFTP